MCLTKDLLVRFYGSLDFSLRALIHYRVMTTFDKPFDYFLVEEPWRVLEVLERALGRHNAELLLNMLAEWLRRNNCIMSREQLARCLSSREMWGVIAAPWHVEKVERCRPPEGASPRDSRRTSARTPLRI